jgi:glycosyltransferase involved in cell wall biosynthesis
LEEAALRESSVELTVIIPTFNRRQLVERAVRSVLAQTRSIEDIIVVDDGSTDGTGDALAAAFDDRIRYVWQANRGVAAARNHGLRLARGRYIAFLDSDDEWTPEKTDRQVRWLEAHPDFGLVLCDVIRQYGDRPEHFRRRELLPEDGDIFKWVLLEPSFVPASAMIRREVYEDVGGFDESLPTAEDLDYHLRIAARWQIGIVEEALVRAMRGHDGLSSLSRTYSDYARVLESAVAANADRLTADERNRALARAYARSARGLMIIGRQNEGWTLARQAWNLTGDFGVRRDVLALAPLVIRRRIAAWRRRGSRQPA